MSEGPEPGLLTLDVFPNHVKSQSENQRPTRWSDDTLQGAETISSKGDSADRTSHNRHSTSKREKVRTLGHGFKNKTKRLLKRRNETPAELEAEDDGYENPYEDIQDDPAFEPSQLIKHKRHDVEGITDRTIDALVAGAKAIAHPRTAAKRMAASKVAVEDKPYISYEADQEFLEAHDSLDKAKSRTRSSRASHVSDADSIEDNEANIRHLEELRQSRKVAWTTTHHIKRVIVVPLREVQAPRKADFYVRNPHTGKQHLDWRSWLSALQKDALQNFANNSMGHVDFASHPPFDRDVMTRQLGRLLVASAPWQSWFSSIRQIYRWEDPSKTRKWFAIWSFIWYLDYCVTFSLGYAAFLVLQNRFRSKNIVALRQSYDRAHDRGTAAYKFNELISQHGSDKWLDPMLEELGPKIQSQIMDLASLLEVLTNFYEWRVPARTWSTLFWFFCAILLGTLTSTQYSVKIVWMFCILYFFLGFWVASHYPQYRHIVNSFLWIFWDIPDDGEWSMMYLRSKAQTTRARLIELQIQKRHDQDLGGSSPQSYVGNVELATEVGQPETSNDADSDSDAASYATAECSTSVLEGLDILSFQCHTRGIRGQLIIYSDGLRFERLGKERWRQSWTDLIEMRKTESDLLPGSTALPGLSKIEGLFLTFTNKVTINLGHVKRRDRAFNCIIGFSSLRFQVLPTAADEECLNTVIDMKVGQPKDGTLWPKDEEWRSKQKL